MKVKFLKDHLGKSEGDIADLKDTLANYLIRVKVAEAHKEDSKPKAVKAKKK